MKQLVKNIFFSVLILKIKFAGIFITIFVISASKYMGIVSFKLIGVNCFSEVHSINLFVTIMANDNFPFFKILYIKIFFSL